LPFDGIELLKFLLLILLHLTLYNVNVNIFLESHDFDLSIESEPADYLTACVLAAARVFES
jgi:hypothetical protein